MQFGHKSLVALSATLTFATTLLAFEPILSSLPGLWLEQSTLRRSPKMGTKSKNSQYLGNVNILGTGATNNFFHFTTFTTIFPMILISLLVKLEKLLVQSTIWCFSLIQFLGTPARLDSESRILGSKFFGYRPIKTGRTIRITGLGKRNFIASRCLP